MLNVLITGQLGVLLVSSGPIYLEPLANSILLAITTQVVYIVVRVLATSWCLSQLLVVIVLNVLRLLTVFSAVKIMLIIVRFAEMVITEKTMVLVHNVTATVQLVSVTILALLVLMDGLCLRL